MRDVRHVRSVQLPEEHQTTRLIPVGFVDAVGCGTRVLIHDLAPPLLQSTYHFPPNFCITMPSLCCRSDSAPTSVKRPRSGPFARAGKCFHGLPWVGLSTKATYHNPSMRTKCGSHVPVSVGETVGRFNFCGSRTCTPCITSPDALV